MRHLLLAGLALPGLSAAFPRANPLETSLELCTMTRVTISNPPVYVTVQATETVYVTCDDCVAPKTIDEAALTEAGNNKLAAYYTTTSTLPSTTSASALWSKSASGPAVTLLPTVHWGQNTTDLNNLVPSGNGNVYYASNGSCGKSNHSSWHLHLSVHFNDYISRN